MITYLAQSTAPISAPTLNVPLPGLTLTEPALNGGVLEVNFLGQYIVGVFDFALVLIVLLGIIVIIAGGIRYSLAAGNASSVKQARDMITGAITGIAIAYTAYSILALINPETVNFRPFVLESVEKEMFAGAPYTEYQSYAASNPTLESENPSYTTALDGAGKPIKPTPENPEAITAALAKAYDELVQEYGNEKELRKAWQGKCLQFAHALILKAKAPAAKNSNQIYSYLPLVKDKGTGGNAFAGLTLNQFSEHADIVPGMVIHVKVNYDIANPAYKPKDAFHHWYTYLGKDSSGKARFADSFNKNWTGAGADSFLRKWVANPKYKSTYDKVSDWFAAHPDRPEQPTITGVYFPF